MKNFNFKFAISFAVCLVLSLFSGGKAYAFTDQDYLKVKINQADGMGFKAYSSYDMYMDGNLVSYNVSDGEYFKIQKNNGQVKIVKGDTGELIASGAVLEFRQKNPSSLQYCEVEGIDGLAFSKYPDNFIFKYTVDGASLLCINSVRIESYVKGVLPYEMSSSYELEALKAQALAARTYAIKNIGRYLSYGYDLTNDTYCQVYKGYSTTDFAYGSRVYTAVEGTRGKVLTYNNALITALFYAANGGQTAEPSIVWGGSYGYFTPKADPYDNYSWSVTKSYDEVRSTLLSKGKSIGTIKDINVTSQTDYGYVTDVRVTDTDGGNLDLSKESVRTAFGLKSMQYTITKVKGIIAKGIASTICKTDSVYVKSASGVSSIPVSTVSVKSTQGVSPAYNHYYMFNGKGYGHGVGMSQIGANARAKAGQSYIDIINFYYDNVVIKDNYGN